jgi:hypothetical protein
MATRPLSNTENDMGRTWFEPIRYVVFRRA